MRMETRTRNVYLYNGDPVSSPSTIQIDPRAETPMYGRGVLDRLRGFRGSDGQMRIIALVGHLERTRKSAERVFGREFSLEEAERWKQWIICAVRESGLDCPYIHLGIVRFETQQGATMLQRQGGGKVGVFIYVETAPALYGDQGLIVSSENRYPRPDGVLCDVKGTGLYAELIQLKARARSRLPDEDPARVEALLFAQSAFRSAGHGRVRVATDDSTLVAEYGCSNAFALDETGVLHLPDSGVRFFHGLTVRIVEVLYKAYNPGGRIQHDLRRNHLRYGGGSAGTAGGVVPVVKLDGSRCIQDDRFAMLQAQYLRLCNGTLDNQHLLYNWAPVVCKGSS